MPEGMGYNPEELAAYLASIRGQNVNSITDQVPSFTNISQFADAGAFDVRSPEQRLADDVREEQKIMALSAENEKQMKEKNSIRTAELDSINDSESLRQLHSKAEHDLKVKIQADFKAIDEEYSIPMFDRMLSTIMGSGGDFQSDPNYITVWGQRQAAILKANNKKKDLAPTYEDSQYYIQRIEDKLTTVEPIEAAVRARKADQDRLFIGAAAERGFTPKEVENVAIINDVSVDEIRGNPTYLTDMSDKRVEWLDAYTKNPKQFTAADVALHHPESVDDYLKLEAARIDRTKTEVEKQGVIKEWSEKAEKESNKIQLSKEQLDLNKRAGAKPKDVKAQLDTARYNEYIKVIDAEKKKYKRGMIVLTDTSLKGTGASDQEIEEAKMAQKTIDTYLKGRSILDLSQREVFMLSLAIGNDSRITTRPVQLLRKMMNNLISNFNAENGDTLGIYLTTDDLAAWGVQP